MRRFLDDRTPPDGCVKRGRWIFTSRRNSASYLPRSHNRMRHMQWVARNSGVDSRRRVADNRPLADSNIRKHVEHNNRRGNTRVRNTIYRGIANGSHERRSAKVRVAFQLPQMA